MQRLGMCNGRKAKSILAGPRPLGDVQLELLPASGSRGAKRPEYICSKTDEDDDGHAQTSAFRRQLRRQSHDSTICRIALIDTRQHSVCWPAMQCPHLATSKSHHLVAARSPFRVFASSFAPALSFSGIIWPCGISHPPSPCPATNHPQPIGGLAVPSDQSRRESTWRCPLPAPGVGSSPEATTLARGLVALLVLAVDVVVVLQSIAREV